MFDHRNIPKITLDHIIPLLSGPPVFSIAWRTELKFLNMASKTLHNVTMVFNSSFISASTPKKQYELVAKFVDS